MCRFILIGKAVNYSSPEAVLPSLQDLFVQLKSIFDEALRSITLKNV